MILAVLHRSRARIAAVSAISALAGVANIWLLALIGRNAQLATPGVFEAAEFAAALACMFSINFLSQLVLSKLSAALFYRLREQLVHGMGALTTQEIDAIGRHRLHAALTKDVPAIHDLLIVLPTYVFNLTVVLACLAYLGSVSLALFGVVVAFLALALGVAKFAIADRAEKKFHARRGAEDELLKCYEAIIDGNKELRLNRLREQRLVEGDFRAHAEKYRDATLAAELFWNLSNNWSTAVIFIGAGALPFLARVVGATGGAVTTFIMVIFYMVGPLTILMNSFRTVHAAKVGLARLAELKLDAVRERRAPSVRDTEAFVSLAARGVTFGYSSDEEHDGFRVGPFNFDIRAGEIVYFVGGNGSGKTTAAKVLTGLYAGVGGAMRVNGRDATDPAAYLARFSAVFQDYYLFDTLVPKGGGEVDAATASAWVEKLRLSDKVAVENGRFSTTKLSYGQRKRLALLVAYFEDSDIYVFDEWAADQDQEFREFFYKEFLLELKLLGKAVIVVSHDDRYFHLADRVVKFERGQIVAVVDNVASRAEAAALPEPVGA